MIGPNRNCALFVQKTKEEKNVGFHEQRIPLTESLQSDRPHIIAAVLSYWLNRLPFVGYSGRKSM
jgi:hypothetical protein